MHISLNELQAIGLFAALDSGNMLIDPSTSGRKYPGLVNNTVVIHNEKLMHCLDSGYKFIPIRAHAAGTMPCVL